MPERYPLTVHVPIRGKLLLRIDGAEVLHEVGNFSQDVPVVFTADAGEVSFQFDPKFWEGAVKPKGGRNPDPLPVPRQSTHDIVLEMLDVALAAFPDDLASRIVERLGREGRLRA